MGHTRNGFGSGRMSSYRNAAGVGMVKLMVEAAEEIAEAGVRTVLHALEANALEECLDILGRRTPRPWHAQWGDPTRHGRVNAHGGRAVIKGRLHPAILG